MAKEDQPPRAKTKRNQMKNPNSFLILKNKIKADPKYILKSRNKSKVPHKLLCPRKNSPDYWVWQIKLTQRKIKDKKAKDDIYCFDLLLSKRFKHKMVTNTDYLSS